MVTAPDQCAQPSREDCGPWLAMVLGGAGWDGRPGNLRPLLFVKTAVLWVDGLALHSYWERDLPVGPGSHL